MTSLLANSPFPLLNATALCVSFAALVSASAEQIAFLAYHRGFLSFLPEREVTPSQS
jgi:hypothetical protein